MKYITNILQNKQSIETFEFYRHKIHQCMIRMKPIVDIL